MNKYLAASLILCALIAGVGIGYYVSPAYSQPSMDNSMSLGKADNFFDLRYLDAMGSHHLGAILLAEQLKAKTQRTELQQLADMILTNEPKAIAQLANWKKDWYGDTSPIPEPRYVPRLGDYDDKFDLRFLNALIAHHADGIPMSDEALAKSSRTEVLNDASGVKQFLTDSGAMLKGWRQGWYGIAQ